MLFQSLDVIIAFAGVMLLLSLLVTIVVQVLISIAGLRGKNLVWGVQQLLRHAAPELKAEGVDLRDLARKALTGFSEGVRPPTAVHPRDLLLMLDSVRAGGDVSSSVNKALAGLAAESPALSEEEATDLATALQERLGSEGEAVAAAVQEVVGKAKQTAGRFGEWFDLAMDAASERFKLWSRWITAAVAVVLAFGFGVDSVDILRQLSVDPQLQAAVLEQIPKAQGLYEALQEAPAESDAKKRLEKLEENWNEVQGSLQKSSLRIFKPFEDRGAFWSNLNPLGGEFLQHTDLLGTLMSVLLLSLGAPFWYGALGKLLRFRAIVRRSSEQDQAER